MGYTYGQAKDDLEAPNYVSHNSPGVDVPDFQDEFRFGDNVAEFDTFLMKGPDGNIPGERRAKIERAVATASPDQYETKDTPDNERERVQQAKNLDEGDLAKIKSRGTEYVGRFVASSDATVGDKTLSFELLHDEDGNVPDSQVMDAIKTKEDVRGNQTFLFSDFLGEIDKEATAQNTDVTIPPARGNSDEADPVRDFFAEANATWAKSAGHSEAGRTNTAQNTAVRDGYSVSNPHETVTKGIEALQEGDKNAIEDMAKNQPEMLAAMLEIMDGASELDELLSELGFS
jgi:hypothetical protein